MRRLALCLLLSATCLGASPARGDEPRQASRHFQRGVALYGEADYRAALVEFKRAYSLAPNPAVLYNVGETQYQLQDYAGALATFEHFVAETGPGDSSAARWRATSTSCARAWGASRSRRCRRGPTSRSTTSRRATTPLDRAILVSVGHRKVVATMTGRAPVTRYVDVAADDSLTVTLQLPEPPAEPSTPAEARTLPALPPADASQASHAGGTLRILGWTTTGALAAGAVAMGVLAVRQSRDLERRARAFPASAPDLSHDASLTSTYSASPTGSRSARSSSEAPRCSRPCSLIRRVPPTRGSTGDAAHRPRAHSHGPS